jgi:hypothetical protein
MFSRAAKKRVRKFAVQDGFFEYSSITGGIYSTTVSVFDMYPYSMTANSNVNAQQTA